MFIANLPFGSDYLARQYSTFRQVLGTKYQLAEKEIFKSYYNLLKIANKSTKRTRVFFLQSNQWPKPRCESPNEKLYETLKKNWTLQNLLISQK